MNTKDFEREERKDYAKNAKKYRMKFQNFFDC